MSESLREDLQELLNFHSVENGSDTPDFILADYLLGCIDNFDQTLVAREKWYGRAIIDKEEAEL